MPPALSTATATANKATVQTKRAEPYGISPKDLIGKVLRKVRRSQAHPALTLYFTDNTIFQIRVDGYDPANPGLPKEFELDWEFEKLLDPDGSMPDLNLTIANAAAITMKDSAGYQGNQGQREDLWANYHTTIALKFEG